MMQTLWFWKMIIPWQQLTAGETGREPAGPSQWEANGDGVNGSKEPLTPSPMAAPPWPSLAFIAQDSSESFLYTDSPYC